MIAQDNISIAHWITNVAYHYHSLEDWCTTIVTLLKQARDSEMDILVMPEYVSECWMHFSPPGLKEIEELSWLSDQAKKALPVLQSAVQEAGVALVAGSFPWEDNSRILNRCWMIFPDRDPAYHDKLVMTPFENDPKSWTLDTGKTVRVFNWRGLQLAVLICLDIEMPSLSYKLAQAGIDLLFVPSMTKKASGYHRVFGCAKARAVELMCAVCVVGCVGQADIHGRLRDPNFSGAAVYIPCEDIFGFDGTFQQVAAHTTAEDIGSVMYAANIPVSAIKHRRMNDPEVWPGPWSADHIEIEKI